MYCTWFWKQIAACACVDVTCHSSGGWDTTTAWMPPTQSQNWGNCVYQHTHTHVKQHCEFEASCIHNEQWEGMLAFCNQQLTLIRNTPGTFWPMTRPLANRVAVPCSKTSRLHNPGWVIGLLASTEYIWKSFISRTGKWVCLPAAKSPPPRSKLGLIKLMVPYLLGCGSEHSMVNHMIDVVYAHIPRFNSAPNYIKRTWKDIKNM